MNKETPEYKRIREQVADACGKTWYPHMADTILSIEGIEIRADDQRLNKLLCNVCAGNYMTGEEILKSNFKKVI